MPQGDVTRTAAGRRNVPSRSANAELAHANGDVRWVIDLGQPAALRVAESVDASRRYAIRGLSFLAAAVWVFNLGMLVSHAG